MNVYLLILLATGITFLATVLGSTVVFFVKGIGEKFNKICLGLASGIMVAGSVWSLLIPSMQMGSDDFMGALPAFVGLLLGLIFFLIIDKFISYKQKKYNLENKRSKMLFTAVTLHNIPEGMAVGLTCALAVSSGETAMASAIALAIGVAIQNIPEGAAISLPLYQDSYSKKKAFFYGAISGIVEPIGGLITALIVGAVSVVLPYLLSFAAGAMLFVVASELMPESAGDDKLGASFFIIGFLIMMSLDVLLG